MTAQENSKMIRTIFDALNRRDFDTIQKHIATNAEIINIPRDQTFKGPEGVRQLMQNRINIASDGKCEIKNLIACEDAVAVEYTTKGKHDGMFITPFEGEFPATGKTINLKYFDSITIQNGKITKWHTYFDMATVMRQIGILHEMVHH